MRMPQSQLLLAYREDEEAAEQYLKDHPEEARASHPPDLASWSPEVEYIVIAIDRISEMIATLVATSGNRPPHVRPMRRPLTAIDRARRRASWQRHEALVDEVEEAQRRHAARRR